MEHESQKVQQIQFWHHMATGCHQLGNVLYSRTGRLGLQFSSKQPPENQIRLKLIVATTTASEMVYTPWVTLALLDRLGGNDKSHFHLELIDLGPTKLV